MGNGQVSQPSQPTKRFKKGNGGSNIQLTFAAMKLRENILVTLVDMGFLCL